MNKKELIIIAVAVLVLVVVGTTLIILNNKKEEKTDTTKEDIQKAITESEVIKDESVGGLNFTNTTLVNNNGQYTLSIDVTNPATTEIDLEQVKIVLKDKDGNIVTTLPGYIGDKLKPNETRTITAFSDDDLSKVTSKTIEITK